MLHDFVGHTDAVNYFVVDRNYLVSGSRDKLVKVWDTQVPSFMLPFIFLVLYLLIVFWVIKRQVNVLGPFLITLIV